MKLTFCGAAETVTGSCYLLEHNQTKILIDCGLFQGSSELRELNYDAFPFNPSEIEFMVLTHAHIDHSGKIPKLVKNGFKGKIYTTKATIDLCEVMLMDSAHIQEMDAEYDSRRNRRKGLPDIEPLYTTEDAADAMKYFEDVPYGAIINLNEELKIRLNDAGHMLGSSVVEMWVGSGTDKKKIVFSGDLGNSDKPLLRDPMTIDETDYLVMESTYGNRNHPDKSDSSNQLLQIILETLEKNGTVVIPSFAVGRTQELLYEINHYKENNLLGKFNDVKVILDSPLAIKATEIFKNYYAILDDDTKKLVAKGDDPLVFENLSYSLTADESRAINYNEDPKIIISASGMADAGRVRHHIKHNIYKENATILFVGYQAEGTLGRLLLDGETSIKLFGERLAVNARIEHIDYFSGHADHDAMISWIQSIKIKPEKIFLVHGESEVIHEFKDDLVDLGYSIEIGKLYASYQFDEQRFYERKKMAPKLKFEHRVKSLYERSRDISELLKLSEHTLSKKELNKISVFLDCIKDIIDLDM